MSSLHTYYIRYRTKEDYTLLIIFMTKQEPTYLISFPASRTLLRAISMKRDDKYRARGPVDIRPSLHTSLMTFSKKKKVCKTHVGNYFRRMVITVHDITSWHYTYKKITKIRFAVRYLEYFFFSVSRSCAVYFTIKFKIKIPHHCSRGKLSNKIYSYTRAALSNNNIM